MWTYLAIFEVQDVVIFGAWDGFSFDVIILEFLDVPFFSVDNFILLLLIFFSFLAKDRDVILFPRNYIVLWFMLLFLSLIFCYHFPLFCFWWKRDELEKVLDTSIYVGIYYK